jgi:hypothetical protein
VEEQETSKTDIGASTSVTSNKKTDDNESDEDIDEALTKEMGELKSDRVTKRFACVDSGVKNVVFINTTVSIKAG